jgi:hypothetical protein
MQKRSRKRIRLIFAHLGLLVLVFGSIGIFFKSASSCTDGERNQGEIDTDCGGPCKPCTEKIVLKPIEIDNYEWVSSFDNKYDFVGSLKNPNNNYGASKFKYRVVIETLAGGETIYSDWVYSFVLPGEQKRLLLQGVELSSVPLKMKIELDLKDIQWEKFTDFEAPEFIVNEKYYEELGGGAANFSRIWGTAINRGNVDFEEVFVKAFLRDSNGLLLATNSDLLGGFKAGNIRGFNMFFPTKFEGKVDTDKIEIEIETNPFDEENLSKNYGKDDEWDALK